MRKVMTEFNQDTAATKILSAATNAKRSYVAATFSDHGIGSAQSFDQLESIAIAVRAYVDHKDELRFGAEVMAILGQ